MPTAPKRHESHAPHAINPISQLIGWFVLIISNLPLLRERRSSQDQPDSHLESRTPNTYRSGKLEIGEFTPVVGIPGRYKADITYCKDEEAISPGEEADFLQEIDDEEGRARLRDVIRSLRERDILETGIR